MLPDTIEMVLIGPLVDEFRVFEVFAFLSVYVEITPASIFMNAAAVTTILGRGLHQVDGKKNRVVWALRGMLMDIICMIIISKMHM